MMKKSTKTLLQGVGVAIVGFWAYSILKKPEKPSAQPNEAAHNETLRSSSDSAKEYVEHRKELLRKKAAAKAAAQEDASVVSASHEVVAMPAAEGVAEVTEPTVVAEEPKEKNDDSINHTSENPSENITGADEE